MARYRPFVYAFNHALRALHQIDVPLRKSPNLRLLFHRNDPKLITATHNGLTSQRKPDVILVFLDDAQNAFSDGDLGSWADHALNTAADPPNNAFNWGEVLSSDEFKRIKPTLPSPPVQYSNQPVKKIPPQTAPNDVYETSQDFPLQQDIAQPSQDATSHTSKGAVPISGKLLLMKD
jgi:hypothetical protein